MACVNFAMDKIEDQSGTPGHQSDKKQLIKHYSVSELIPAPEHPLHRLLKNEPAVWAAVQISSGVLSIGIGVLFAVCFRIEKMLITLFRVPIISGILFLISGMFSLLLYRQPALLQMCFQANIFCLLMSVTSAGLLCADLGKFITEELHQQVEILVLCVTFVDILASIVLIVLIYAEKRRQEKK